jgi:DNA mismatch repair protein MutS
MTEEDIKDSETKTNYKIGQNTKKSSLSCVQEYHLTLVPQDWFTSDTSNELHNSKDSSISVGNSQFSGLEMSAGDALLKYVNYTQRNVTPLLNKPMRFTQETHMAIDFNTRRSLELTKPLMSTNQKASLFGVMNNTSTSAGRRLLYSRLCAPSTKLNVVQSRLDAVDFFHDNRHVADTLHKELRQCSDIERRLQKVKNFSCDDVGDVSPFFICCVVKVDRFYELI